MNWFFYALLSAICMTVFSILVKRLLKDKGDTKAFTFLLDFSAGVFILFLSFFEKKYSNLNTQSLIIILALALVYAIVDLLFIKGRQLEEVSKVTVIMRLDSIWSLMGGALFLKESLLPQKIIGVLLIVAGNLVVLWKKQKLYLSKGLKIILLGSTLFVAGSLVDKYMVGSILSPALYKSTIFFLSSFWILILTPNRFARIKKEFKLQKHSAILTGVLLGSSLYFLVKGFQTGEVSKVFPIQNLSLIFSVLAGIFFLGEKEKMWQKILGAIIAFMGVFLLRG